MADAYDFAVLSKSPTFYYALDEAAAATSFVDQGAFTQPLTTINGVVQRGHTSVVDGIPAGKSAYQDKDTFLASRAYNGFVDGSNPRLTVSCVIRPDRIKANHALISKANSYILSLVESRLKLTLLGVGAVDFQSDYDLVYSGDNIHVAGVLDGPAGQVRLYVNGIRVLTAAVSTSSVHAAASTGLEVGGHSSLGASGISGAIAKVGIWLNTALTDADFHDFYLVGPRELETDEVKVVFPWPRQILDADITRTKVKLTNPDDVPVSMQQTDEAAASALGGGDYLAPFGGRVVWEGYTGEGTAMLDSQSGWGRVMVREGG